MAFRSEARQFVDSPAVREQVPLLVGLVGPSGGGKTFSALRLATGIQRIYGGDIQVIDTEAKRALHYADRFKFRHLPFVAPFSPADYQAAIAHCIDKGARTIIVDSMSHEHTGQGGVLEMHEAETQRLSKGDDAKAERVKMLAWQRPKSERMRLINAILQAQCNFIFCFRAKEKLKLERGKDPTPLGWMPVAGEEFVFEMTVNMLLLPNSGGVPTWQSDYPGERVMIKLPEQFKNSFAKGEPLSEDTGVKLAEWANGGTVPAAAPMPARQAPAPSAASPPSDDDRKKLMRRLFAALRPLQLGEADADEKDLSGKEREEFLRPYRLRYLSWCCGREIKSSDELSATDADVVIRRAELGEVP